MRLTIARDAPTVPADDLKAWLAEASRIEAVHRAQVAWLRSRLPGYPMLLVPHLVRGTSLVTEEFTYRLPWTREELSAGYQFQGPPAEDLLVLSATVEQVERAREAMQLLANALCETSQWQRFRVAHASLSTDDRSELRAARRAVVDALQPTAIDAHEPDLALPRDAYRQQVVADAVGALTGAAREYADAFDDADRLLELAGSDVFGQLVFYGTVSLLGVTDLSVNGAKPGMVEFVVEDDALFDVGAVCWLDDPLFPEAIHVTAQTINLGHTIGARIRASGRALAGTAAVWSRSTRSHGH